MRNFPMKDALHILSGYLRHLVRARHRKGHGIHSPFVYDLTEKAIFNKDPYPHYEIIDRAYRDLRTSEERLKISEVGAGSKYFRGPDRPIREMLQHASVSLKNGKLLSRISNYLKPAHTIELGTSIGFSTLCLAAGNPQGKVRTIEGNTDLCRFAGELFRQYGLSNIETKPGLFSAILPSLLEGQPPPDMVFIDGHHACEPTVRYFEQFISHMDKGLIIFDDIHWSKEMDRAWKIIRSDPRCVLSMDLYRMGIICPDKSITPGHYLIRF